VLQYVSAPFSGEGTKARHDFAQWRTEWKDAEKAMKDHKGTAADFFNRLQPALAGRALRIAQEFKGRQDPYGEAMKKLHNEYGDEVELALEHLRPIKDPLEAMDAAEKAWERFSAQETPLQKRGIELTDLLWHQMVLKILPSHLEPQKKWVKWIEEQRRNHSQTQANLPEGKIKKGKNNQQPGFPGGLPDDAGPGGPPC
jgi:hypothetical protein